jgi:NAD(P)-dependent dehydrogenase (short-subunit alcohol dehydrogenase family)
LYHHFDSKEAIVVELVHRYHDDLDRVAKEALDTLHEPKARSVEEKILDFGHAIAACGVEHRAALLLTLYEPPMVAGAIKEFGRLDVVVSNAGIFQTAAFEHLTPEEWERMVNVHLHGAFS